MKKFKLSKKLLFGSLGVAALGISVPVVLTSCAEDTNSKSVDFIDLSKYKSVETAGIKSYTFMSLTANDNFKGKSEGEIKSTLGISDSITGGKISKDAFDKLINNLTFTNTDLSGNIAQLIWSDVKTSALDNANVNNTARYMSGTIMVTFSLTNGATWSNGSSDVITFSVMANTPTIPTV